jgi:hypothetical protein
LTCLKRRRKSKKIKEIEKGKKLKQIASVGGVEL